VLLAGLFAIAACGGDDDDADAATATTAARAPAPTTAAAPTATAGGEDDEFCAIAAELNAQDAPPTLEMVDRYLAAAPEELQGPTQTVRDAMAAADGDYMAVFGDPDAAAALEELTAIESEVCGTPAPADEGPDQDPSVTVLDAAATRVEIEATEYMFHGDLPTAAGRYSFVMTNGGEEPHIMVLARLEDGATLEEALASEGDEGVAEEFESGFAMPGGEGVLTADLGPGNWVLLCPIPGPTGTPHFVDGMIHEFTIS
jgi:hypothetical protein